MEHTTLPAVERDRSVAVFRLQLFKRSEPFIIDQAMNVPGYAPIFTGRKIFGPQPPHGDVAEAEAFGKRMSQVAILTASPKPYLRALPRRPDIVHAHFGVDGVYALRVARALKRPLVTTLHGFDVTSAPAYFLKSKRVPLLRFAMERRRLQRYGDLFICVSDFIRDQAISAGFPRERTVVHYMGLPLPAWTGVPEHNGTILHVARLVEKKGTIYLLEAMGEMALRGVQAKLIIVGEGPLRMELENKAETLGILDQVIFAGPRSHDEVLGMIASATVLALPSVRAASGDAEGLGMVLLEAASFGIPVVGTRSGGIPEAIEDGRSGFLVPERDARTLADRLVQVLTDEPLRIELGIGARRLVERRFDARQQGGLLASIYDEVIALYDRNRK